MHDRRALALGVFALLGSLAACSSDTGMPAIVGPNDGAVATTDGGDATAPGVDASDGASSKDAGDSATADAGGDGGRDFSTDKNKFFGASRCAAANVQLCEDFESGALDTATWTVSGTTPVVDGVQKARGAKALHITRNGNGPSYIKETKTFPEPNNAYYGRAFFYFKSLPATPMTYAHWTFVAASGTGVSGEIRLSGQLQNNLNHFGVGTDNRVDPNGTGDWTNSDNDPGGNPAAVPTDTWVCIEWLHKGDTNETRFYWDDVEHLSLYTSSTMHGGNTNPYLLPQFTEVWLGWQEYQPSTEVFELWVDEIAIDKARIGCVL